MHINRMYIATISIWIANKHLLQKYIFLSRDMSLCLCGSLCHQGCIRPVLFPPNRFAENISNIYNNKRRYNFGVLVVIPFAVIFMPLETDREREQSFVRGMFTYTASTVSTALNSEWQTRNVKFNNLMKSWVEIWMEEKWMQVILRKVNISVSKSRKSI